MRGIRHLALFLGVGGVLLVVLGVARVFLPLSRVARTREEFYAYNLSAGNNPASPLRDWEGTRLQSGILCLSGGFMLVGGILLSRRKSDGDLTK